MRSHWIGFWKKIGGWFTKYNWLKECAYALKLAYRALARAGAVLLNLLLTFLLVGAICGVIVGCAFVVYLTNYMDASVEQFDMLTSNQDRSTSVYYMNEQGEVVEMQDEKLFSTQNRVWVPYSSIPKNLVNAYIAIEDKRFEDHHGVDWIRTISATGYYLIGKSSYGGSTITQQLIKNITGEDDTTVQRKIEEIFRALNLEKTKTKSEIMEMYLNTIYLSQGCWGVQAASYKYFGKPVSELSLIECAAIAGITQSPTKWDPILNPMNNKQRRDTILSEMLDQGKITLAEFNEAYDKELILSGGDPDEVSGDLPSEGEAEGENPDSVTSWYMDAAIEDAAALLMEHYDITYQVAIRMIFSGGLQLVLAMDPEVQAIMDEVYSDEEMINSLVGASESLIQPESAMVVIDPDNGNVLGIVGGRGKKTKSRIFNYATDAKRQPGSSLKPLAVYAPAMEAGIINYGTVYDDSPVMFNKENGSYKPWPKNSPSRYGGLTPVYDAIARSVNTIAVRVLQDLGLENSFSFLKDTLNMDSLILNTEVKGKKLSDMNLSSLALGGLTFGVTVREITAGYTIFTNDGIYCAPRTVLKILDSSGEEIVNNLPDYKVAISEENAAIMTKMLQNVVDYGTGAKVTLKNRVQTAGKTGTTSSNYDRWFIGYTPYYLGGVWFGYENQQTLSGFSGNPSMKIWDEVMNRLHDRVLPAPESGQEVKTFDVPPSVITRTFCVDSGELPTNACALDPRGSGRTATGYFTVESAPKTSCKTHVLVKYCASGQAIASDNCPAGDVRHTALLRIPNRNFKSQVVVADAQYAYRPLTAGKTVRAAYNLPFFAGEIPSGSYVGVTSSSSSSQFNHYCTAHYGGGPYIGPLTVDIAPASPAQATAPAAEWRDEKKRGQADTAWDE